MVGRKLRGVPHGRRRRSSSVCGVGKRSLRCRVHWGSRPPVSPPGVRRSSPRARPRCNNSRALAVRTHAPAGVNNWAHRPWTVRCGTPRAAGSTRSALYGPGGRDDAPGHGARHRAALWPGACLSCGEPRTRHRLRAAARALAGGQPARALGARYGCCPGGGEPSCRAGVAVPGCRRAPGGGPAAPSRSPPGAAPGPAREACAPAAGPHAAGASAWPQSP
jgi:hypothetical protein